MEPRRAASWYKIKRGLEWSILGVAIGHMPQISDIFLSIYLKFRTTRYRKNLTLQSSRPEVVYPIVEPVMWLFYHWAVSVPAVVSGFYLSVNSSLCRYSYGQFIEINSHSLFSKWFSEVHPAVWILLKNPEVACHIQYIYCSEDFVLMSSAYSLTQHICKCTYWKLWIESSNYLFFIEWQTGHKDVSEDPTADWW